MYVCYRVLGGRGSVRLLWSIGGRGSGVGVRRRLTFGRRIFVGDF